MDSVTTRIFQDQTLAANVPHSLSTMLQEFLDCDEAEQTHKYYNLRYFRFDLKYIAKPDLMPLIAGNTTIVEDMIEALYKLHFRDA